PSIVLQAPFHVVAGLVAIPVYVIENEELLPEIERILSTFELEGIRPVAGYSSTKGFIGGVALRKGDLFAEGVGFGLKGSYSTNMYRFSSIVLGGERWGNGPFGLVGEFGWQARTRERFHGIGPSSRLEDESNYGYRGIFGSLQAHYEFSPALQSMAFGASRRVDPRDGRLTSTPHVRDSIAALFPNQDLYGLFERLDLYEFGAQVSHDWRERSGSPLSGGTEVLRVSRVSGSGSSDTTVGFWRVYGDVSHYLNVYRGRVIGVRVLAQVTEPDAGTRIPFYELSQLGGSDNLRGFRSGRFIGQDMAMFTLEYRWPLWRHLDAFLFTDQGRVFGNLEDDFSFSNFQSSYGGGIRIWNQLASSEMSVAKSNEKLRFYLSFGAL
ncbi:MAG: BamA/TamA family outer membrane protein, partial [candidate division Zixibacteria bacterium]|nr:BamA/TamA family outer membrane protein [candidate division Zixibacteria bacterium]